MSTEPAKISIVIPYLNQPEHLDNCLKSLMRQDFDLDQVEIFVVDNGSKLLPTDICAAYANVQLVEEMTPGPGPARNKGISVSRAPLLAFIDADCIAGDGWLEAIARAFAAPNTEVVGGDVRIGIANPSRITMLEAYESIYAYRQKLYIERLGFSGTGNLAMRRAVYAAIGPFAGINIAEDRDWGRRAAAKGYKTTYLPEMVIYHPARKTFAELQLKWDRHMSHLYEEEANGFSGKVRWFAKAIALAISPLLEIGRILGSNRVPNARAKLLAFVALTRIRLHRSRRALQAMLARDGDRRSEGWNRQ